MQRGEKDFAALVSRGYVSLRQFSKIIGVSYPTATKMNNEGKVKGIRVGGITRIYSDELHRYLTEGNAVEKKGVGGEIPPTTPIQN